MNQPNSQQQGLQLAKNDKVYFLILQGGIGARILQTAFIRTLVRQRKAEKNNYPILVCDNTLYLKYFDPSESYFEALRYRSYFSSERINWKQSRFVLDDSYKTGRPPRYYEDLYHSLARGNSFPVTKESALITAAVSEKIVN